ncbi:hypothetical protein EON65_39195 [archaeon]|nr:MAG: hypothetical protein EON65_39195 [archaeon]
MRRERQMRSLLRRERLRHPSSTETQGTKPPTNDKHCSRGTKVQTVDASGPRDIKVWRHRQQAAVRYQGILAKWARKMESE